MELHHVKWEFSPNVNGVVYRGVAAVRRYEVERKCIDRYIEVKQILGSAPPAGAVSDIIEAAFGPSIFAEAENAHIYRRPYHYLVREMRDNDNKIRKIEVLSLLDHDYLTYVVSSRVYISSKGKINKGFNVLIEDLNIILKVMDDIKYAFAHGELVRAKDIKIVEEIKPHSLDEYTPPGRSSGYSRRKNE